MKKKKQFTKYTQEQRIALLSAYESSGMTIREFSERAGVSSRTIGNWLRDRRDQTGTFRSQESRPQSFIQLPSGGGDVPAERKKRTASIIVRRNDWSVEIPAECERAALHQVLSALEGLYAV